MEVASKFDRISVALLCMLASLTFLFPYHAPPLTTFHAEAFTFLLVLLLGLVALRAGVELQMSGAALCCILFFPIYAALFPGDIHERIFFVSIYINAAALVFVCANAYASAVMRPFLTALAIAGVIMSWSGIVEYFNIEPLGLAIRTARTPASGMIGVIGQPNNFAAFLACSLAALFALRYQYAFLLAAPIVFGMAYSGSRVAWVLLVLTLLAAWGDRKSVMLWAAAFMMFAVLRFAPDMQVVERAADLTTAVQQTVGSRWAYAQVALRIWLDSPWFGAGFGEFAYQSFVHAQPGDLTTERHAHNIVLQVLAESGIVGLALLSAALFLWAKDVMWSICFRSALGRAFITVLLIVAVFSFTEFPLWHAQFLMLTAAVMGMLPAAVVPVTIGARMRWSISIVLLACLFLLGAVTRDYKEFEQFAQTDTTQIEIGHSLFRPQIELAIAASGMVERRPENAERELQLIERTLHVFPKAELLCRYATLLYAFGSYQKADDVLRRGMILYPWHDCITTK